ncbi:MAG TPA: MmcQ/YjbR family DNA-binding protein [Bryobacteraceae bacterium]|jgi:hypothetical protein|nr:MmcQ/YjbR family DNA-binding protein [Bryobacteraceae bacterium]
MTADDFRRLALELPGTVESAHMGHPDFRVNGKIFATLNYPDEHWGMVKLPPEEQDNVLKLQSKAFVPVKGAWGRQGCTNVRLGDADSNALRHALRSAWDRASVLKKRTVRKRT